MKEIEFNWRKKKLIEGVKGLLKGKEVKRREEKRKAEKRDEKLKEEKSDEAMMTSYNKETNTILQ